MARRDIAANRRFWCFLPANSQAQHIHAGVGSDVHDLETFIDRVATPLIHQLGAVKADNQRIIITDSLLDGVDQLDQETRPVLDRPAIFVGPLVSEAGEKISQQITHKAGDLDAVKSGTDR